MHEVQVKREHESRNPSIVRGVPTLPRLRGQRERQALTQLELAVKAGLTPTTISHLETGRTEARLPTVRKLAKALGLKPVDLMGPEDE